MCNRRLDVTCPFLPNFVGTNQVLVEGRLVVSSIANIAQILPEEAATIHFL